MLQRVFCVLALALSLLNQVRLQLVLSSFMA